MERPFPKALDFKIPRLRDECDPAFLEMNGDLLERQRQKNADVLTSADTLKDAPIKDREKIATPQS